jgi:hypothetical protein
MGEDMMMTKFPNVALVATLAILGGASSGYAQIACSRPGAQNGTCTADTALISAAKTKLKGVLYYEWANNNNHASGRTAMNNSLVRLSNQYGFRLDRGGLTNGTFINSYITAQTLTGIDVVISNQADQDPFQNTTSLQAIRNFVEVQGKAVWMNHASAAYIPCPDENLSNTGCRWAMRTIRTQFWIHNPDNTRARIFADTVSIGQIPANSTGSSAVAATRNHGTKNIETKNIFKEGLPANGGTGPTAASTLFWDGMGDEWYNYRNNPRLEGERVIDGVTFGPINILVSLDENSVAANAGCNGGSNACKNQGTFGDRPVTWTRKVGEGLAMHQNAGHSDIYIRARVVDAVNVADSLITKLNWRLLKYLARDFQGCMDVRYQEFNPDATVEVLTPIDTVNTLPVYVPVGGGPARRSPCQVLKPNSSISAQILKGQIKGIKVAGNAIQIPTSEQGNYKVQISNVAGKTVFSQNIAGGSNRVVTANGLSKGLYLVRVNNAKLGEAVARVTLR